MVRQRLAGWLLASLCVACADDATEQRTSTPPRPGESAGQASQASRRAPWIQLSELSDEGGRVVSPSLASEGFLLPGGHSLQLDVVVGFEASLRFAIALRPQSQELLDRLPRLLDVHWDGQPLPVGDLPADNQVATLHDIPLPGTQEGELSSHRLQFSVPPGPGQVIVHGPAIRPTQRALRRPDPARPDVILFVADTFRADDLAHPGLTPRLTTFAESARAFSQARSPSTWTLPSVASLLYGVHPGQHGGVHSSRQPSSPAATLAETMHAAGYRTVAVTDSAFVSRRYGLDRGFEWFQELHQGSLSATLDVAEQLLDADDGRPLLLMVHSYHTHIPYRPNRETRRTLEEQLGIADEGRDFSWYEAVLAELTAEALALGKETDEIRARGAALAPALANLRLATVRELDTGFGRLLDLLAARELADDAIIVFTSDHGEAFNEHGFFYHGRSVFDEVLRVPLLLRAPSLTPARVDAAVSLVDITPTLAELLGLPVDDLWSRATLLDPQPGRAVFSFNWPDAEALPLMSVVTQQLKIVSSADPEQLSQGQLLSVFDLTVDPGERVDLALERQQQLSGWLSDLGPRVAELLAPLEQAAQVELDAQHLDVLRQLGYMGDDG